jgi:hypothetical protein
MDSKTLNALDGDSILAEVQAERIAQQRKAYKQAIKDAVINNDNAQRAASKARAKAEKADDKLKELVDGGMEGFLASKNNDIPAYEKTYTNSMVCNDTGNPDTF